MTVPLDEVMEAVLACPAPENLTGRSKMADLPYERVVFSEHVPEVVGDTIKRGLIPVDPNDRHINY